jgi:hypothetical protein
MILLPTLSLGCTVIITTSIMYASVVELLFKSQETLTTITVAFGDLRILMMWGSANGIA